MTDDAVTIVRALVGSRGPTPVADLERALRALDIDLTPSELDGVLRTAGLRVEQSGAGVDVAMVDSKTGAVAERLSTTPARRLLLATVVVVLVAVLIVSRLNPGSRTGPSAPSSSPTTQPR